MQYAAYDTTELLRLMAEDDAAAFSELYSRYWQKLFSIAYNRLQEIPASEDVVHDVFVSLWAGRKDLSIQALENYLATAVKYAVLTRIKKLQRERLYKRSLTPILSDELPAESALHHKRILEQVRKEVEKLPARCRLIFQYSRDKGMPVKEIAREMHISPKTVENQLTRALRQLRSATRALISLLPFFLVIF